MQCWRFGGIEKHIRHIPVIENKGLEFEELSHVELGSLLRASFFRAKWTVFVCSGVCKYAEWDSAASVQSCGNLLHFLSKFFRFFDVYSLGKIIKVDSCFSKWTRSAIGRNFMFGAIDQPSSYVSRQVFNYRGPARLSHDFCPASGH